MGNTTRNGVKMHADWNDPWLPSIDVKMYFYRQPKFPDAIQIRDRTGCCNACAQKVVKRAFDVHQEEFWREVDDVAYEAFGGKEVDAQAIPCGHNNGWVSVLNIGEGCEVEEWDDEMLAKWRSFEEEVEALIARLCNLDDVLDTIQECGWLQSCHLLREQNTMGMGGEL